MAATAEEMAPAHTDWLHHTLEVFGHPDTLAALRNAAAIICVAFTMIVLIIVQAWGTVLAVLE